MSPKKGLNIPFLGLLGVAMASLSLSDALFTTTQQKVLGLLYGKPDQSFYANEIARWAQVGKGSIMRELDRLQRAGVLTLFHQGNQTHYRANPDCPIYLELCGIVSKTFGIGEQLRVALEPLAEQLVWAFIYGSIAKGNAHAASDIDLMLIGENLSYSTVMECLIPLEERLGRTINPTLYTLADWRAKEDAGNSFVLKVGEQEKINLIGGKPEGGGNGQQ
ncbi:nucleotidyltransferase domain-containing protein [Paludibacterium yongneupense]|uniref:nucleotidyltransferase domain-containing protein n=1 Tax=Paludibacterium yongneupense TaxID=400061 RepID=UPI001B7FE4E6|nr:nucleotidyltransferase domain-containing protein [Paludibacterium yongneupense]